MNRNNAGMIPPPYSPSRRPPDSVVELIWEGKRGRAKQKRQQQPTAKLKGPAVERRGIRLNSVVCGCLEEVLPDIEPKSIDFVYLDPPFMTQKDFAFNSVSYRRHRLRLVGGGGGGAAAVEKGGEEPAGRNSPAGYSDRWRRAAYLDFLDTAFRLLKPTLKETGSIAVHTDHRAAHWVRCLLDEHFSPENFVNELIWKYGLGNVRSTRHFLRKHDNIAVYAASSVKKYYFKMIRGEVTKAQKAKYCHDDEGGKYMLSYGKKYYLKGGKPLESVLEVPALSATSSERTGYPTQKPTDLLRILIEAFCPPGGCVLDPCCGSGTTLVAAAETGRSWIGIDANADAVRTAGSRIALVE